MLHDFYQIRTFLWIARLGRFRKAAERLHLSQPAVSTRISSLEQELRVSQFERGPGELVLTKQGTVLLSYAEQMLFVEEDIKQRVANPSEAEGLFQVGASETIGQAWLPEFLKAFSQQYPRMNVDLTVDISLNLRAALLDLALSMGRRQNSRWKTWLCLILICTGIALQRTHRRVCAKLRSFPIPERPAPTAN
jgi:DNA-binding transcriptional LysR family regulator